MSQAPSAARAGSTEDSHVDASACVSLRGTTRGLEIVVTGTPSATALGERLTELLAEAPGFFAGSQARVAIDGALPLGALACLEQVAARFSLQLVEIGPATRRRRDLTPVRIAAAVLPAIAVTRASIARIEDTPLGRAAEGSGPIAEQAEADQRGESEPGVASAKAQPTTQAQRSDRAAAPAPGDTAASAERSAGQATAAPSSDAASSAVAASDAAAGAELTAEQGIAAERTAAAAGRAAIVSTGAAASLDALANPGAGAPSTAVAGTVTVVSTGAAASLDALANPGAGAPSAEAAGRAAIVATGAAASLDALANPGAGAPSTAVASTVTVVSTGAAASLDALANPGAAAQIADAASTAAAGEASLFAALAAVLAAAGHQAAAAAADAATVSGAPAGPRLVIGPVRSGRIVDHLGHLIVIGDVNPGAEVRAEGSIIVLGRLRGVAHAAIGREAGCIIALSLQPQQLRIGRMVARAGDADRPSGGAEIAYATGETIVVERFLGRLPSGLAASM